MNEADSTVVDDFDQLLESTRQLLRERMKSEPRAQIANAAGVTKFWLEKFDQGVITNPTIENLRRLRLYLVGSDRKAAA